MLSSSWNRCLNVVKRLNVSNKESNLTQISAAFRISISSRRSFGRTFPRLCQCVTDVGWQERLRARWVPTSTKPPRNIVSATRIPSTHFCHTRHSPHLNVNPQIPQRAAVRTRFLQSEFSGTLRTARYPADGRQRLWCRDSGSGSFMGIVRQSSFVSVTSTKRTKPSSRS